MLAITAFKGSQVFVFRGERPTAVPLIGIPEGQAEPVHLYGHRSQGSLAGEQSYRLSRGARSPACDLHILIGMVKQVSTSSTLEVDLQGARCVS